MTDSSAMLTRAEIARLNGLEFVQGFADGRIQPPSMREAIPFTMLPPTVGTVELHATPSERYLNPMGTVHAGWSLTLLDTAMALAAFTTLDVGELCPTHETSAKFVRPILPDAGPMRITGTVVSRGRTLITLEGQVIDGQGRICAHGTSTCIVVRPAGV